MRDETAHEWGTRLDANALKAVRSYRFKPAKKDGVPVPVEILVDVNFQID